MDNKDSKSALVAQEVFSSFLRLNVLAKMALFLKQHYKTLAFITPIDLYTNKLSRQRLQDWLPAYFVCYMTYNV